MPVDPPTQPDPQPESEPLKSTPVFDPWARYIAPAFPLDILPPVVQDLRKGIFVLADELSGWPGSVERYNKSTRSERAFWLKSYDGVPHGFDRIGRGEIYIPNLSVSILGGIQPDLLAEQRRQGLTSDGLLQRFIMVVGAAPTFRLDRPSHHEAYRLDSDDLSSHWPGKIPAGQVSNEIVYRVRQPVRLRHFP